MSRCQAKTIVHYFDGRSSVGYNVTFGWLSCERMADHPDGEHLSTLPEAAGADAGKLFRWLEQRR